MCILRSTYGLFLADSMSGENNKNYNNNIAKQTFNMHVCRVYAHSFYWSYAQPHMLYLLYMQATAGDATDKLVDETTTTIVSWSFASLQRKHCSTLLIAFSIADMMMRVTLQSIAVQFAEETLSLVRRTGTHNALLLKHDSQPLDNDIAVMVDSDILNNLSLLQLADKRLPIWLSVYDVMQWRVTFRARVTKLTRKHRSRLKRERLQRAKYRGKLALSENCLTTDDCIELIAELCPSAAVLEKIRDDNNITTAGNTNMEQDFKANTDKANRVLANTAKANDGSSDTDTDTDDDDDCNGNVQVDEQGKRQQYTGARRIIYNIILGWYLYFNL
jgi:hypothetical protein